MQYYNIGSIPNSPIHYNFAWSLNQYKTDSKNNKEAWDELEHSIAANIADEIIVGATSTFIEITAIKTFEI